MKSDLNNYIRLEYGMTPNEFKGIKWELNPKKAKKTTPKANITQLNTYFKSEFGMNYTEYTSIVPEVTKKRTLHK